MFDDMFDRRSVLKSIGAGSTTTAMMGTASAESPETIIEEPSPDRVAELRGRYLSEDVVREVIESRAMDVLEELRSEGYIDDASVDTFPVADIRRERGLLAPEDGVDGTSVDAVKWDGEETAIVTTSTTLEGRSISLYVQPERDHAYAFVEDVDGEVHTVTANGDCCPYGT